MWAADKKQARAQALILDCVGLLTHLFTKIEVKGYSTEYGEVTAQDSQ